jgi:hypothetical protein
VGGRWEALLPAIRSHLVVDDADLDLVHRVDDPERAVAILRRTIAAEPPTTA